MKEIVFLRMKEPTLADIVRRGQEWNGLVEARIPLAAERLAWAVLRTDNPLVYLEGLSHNFRVSVATRFIAAELMLAAARSVA